MRERARPEDLVLDFDDICREVGGSHQWAHSRATMDLAEYVMQQRMARVADYPGDAYVIRCAPEPEVRDRLAVYLRASVVVIDPGIAVCLARARTRPRGTTKAIRGWYRRYRVDTYPRVP